MLRRSACVIAMGIWAAAGAARAIPADQMDEILGLVSYTRTLKEIPVRGQLNLYEVGPIPLVA